MPVLRIRPRHHRWYRRPSAFVAIGACTLTMAAGATLSRDAALGREDATIESISHLVADDALDPRVVALSLEGTAWEAEVAALDALLFTRRDAERRRTRAIESLQEAHGELRDVNAGLAERKAAALELDDQIEHHRAVLQARALALFVSFGDDDQLEELDSIDEATSGARHRQLATEVDEHQLALLGQLEQEHRGVDAVITALQERQRALRSDVAALDVALRTATAELADVSERLPVAIAAVREERRRASIPGLDMSVVALDAYLQAEVSLAGSDPSCRLDWWMIAGVGRIESRHGELGARSMNADGRPNRAIIGIPLDGRPGVRAITDTDGGAFDGDTEWDRAVGPMQFIPETWSIRGRDGNGDGFRDPHNLYDAALAAGRYLCRLGGDLSEPANLRDAYFGYNTSSAYVADVEEHARRYEQFDLPQLP